MIECAARVNKKLGVISQRRVLACQRSAAIEEGRRNADDRTGDDARLA